MRRRGLTVPEGELEKYNSPGDQDKDQCVSPYTSMYIRY